MSVTQGLTLWNTNAALAAWACAVWLVPGCGGKQTAPLPRSGHFADVIAVQATGEPGDYLFSVAVSSQDSGCERYADWWEVVRPDGQLVYRRVLAHSHATEQPFTRSGGPVAVRSDDPLIVRAHMNVDGYGGVAMRGTVAGGFTPDSTIGDQFSAQLASAAPLPDGCAF